MNMSVSPEDLDSVCEGCLSPDRPDRTVEASDLEIKKLYYEILNIVEQNVESVTLRLCGECKANILKFVAFKKQVLEAHEVLNKYLLKSSQSNSSKFASRVCRAAAPGADQPRPPACEPLTFVKIEDHADDADDADEYFVDDGCSRDGVDDTDLTAVLKPDLISPNKLNLRVSHKDNKYKDEDFDASDDEPLNKKKKKKEADSALATNTRGSKKGKKGNDVSAAPPAPRKTRAARREKPAGVVDTARVRRKLEQLNVPRGHLEMVVLSWAEVEAERARTLAGPAYLRLAHRCADCALGFNHRHKLLAHLQKHEPSAGSLACAWCGVRCRDQHALTAHRRRHRVRWRCTWCGWGASRAGVAADHVWRAHGGAAPHHRCRLCGARESSLAKLRGHMKNHGERQECELCGKSFRDRTSLRTHLFIHKGEKEYACPRCDKRFLFKKAMEVHLVTHDASAHLYCYECDLNFKNRMSFKQHMKYSLKHVDPARLKHACTVCDKRFMKASRLQEHTLAVHLKATPVACTLPGCSFACASRPVLRTHVRMVHRDGRAVRNHVCHHCGKTYMTKKSLEGHLRAHSGERPFACAQCGATFGYEAALYNHNKLVHRNQGSRAPPSAPPPAPPAPPAPQAPPAP